MVASGSYCGCVTNANTGHVSNQALLDGMALIQFCKITQPALSQPYREFYSDRSISLFSFIDYYGPG